MLGSLLPVRSLLVAMFIIMAGSGFMATLVALQLEATGTSPMLIGPVATLYFVGLTVGSLRVPRIVDRIGHIRAFAAFVSLYSASSLAYAIHQDPIFWGALRLVDGFCMAGVFVCIESWLNDQSEPETRGGVLAAYMIFLYSGQAAGQFLLTLSQEKPSMPFLAASILLSLAVLPVAMTRRAGPPIEARPSLDVRRLYRASPLGIVGAAVTGVMLGAFYALGAVHVRRLGLDMAGAATFMSAVIIGGVLLQWPIGRLSDMFDRRRVIVGTLVAVVAVSLTMAFVPASGAAMLLLGGLFGGLTFALYPLCVAHTNDRLAAQERVAASGGLVLAYSLGAAAGPIPGAAMMELMGPAGLYGFIALCGIGGLAFAAWRARAALPVPRALQQRFQTLPRTTSLSASPVTVPEDEGPIGAGKET
ncbi:MAG: MFS transporter [Sphingomonadales bacterium]